MELVKLQNYEIQNKRTTKDTKIFVFILKNQ